MAHRPDLAHGAAMWLAGLLEESGIQGQRMGAGSNTEIGGMEPCLGSALASSSFRGSGAAAVLTATAATHPAATRVP